MVQFHGVVVMVVSCYHCCWDPEVSLASGLAPAAPVGHALPPLISDSHRRAVMWRLDVLGEWRCGDTAFGAWLAPLRPPGCVPLVPSSTPRGSVPQIPICAF